MYFLCLEPGPDLLHRHLLDKPCYANVLYTIEYVRKLFAYPLFANNIRKQRLHIC